jgi:hypothetical protein
MSRSQPGPTREAQGRCLRPSEHVLSERSGGRHLHDGGPRTASADGGLEDYLRLLAGQEPAGRLIEIRYTTRPGQMAQRFIDATDPGQASRLIAALTRRTDVYTGVLLRSVRSGGRDAVCPSHLVFIETDEAEAAERVAEFTHRPTLLVASGSPGHLHAYWRLRRPVGVRALEQANRRLAHYLGGDLASVDAARMLRLLSVGRAVTGGVSPACSFADASVTSRGARR